MTWPLLLAIVYAVIAAWHAFAELGGGPVAGMPRRPVVVIAVRAVAWPVTLVLDEGSGW